MRSWVLMRKSLVRQSLPLFLLLGVLLAAALMLAARHSPATKEVADPVQNGFIKPDFMQAGPSQNGLAKPMASPYNTPLTVPYVVVAGSKLPQSGPIVW